MKTLTPHKLREILKKLKKNKYYEHVPHIINRLNGEPPPTISKKQKKNYVECLKRFKYHFISSVLKVEKTF